MTSAGIVGIGDMGSGLAKNLIANGFETWGYDPDPRRIEAFSALGGSLAPMRAMSAATPMWSLSWS